MAPNAHAEAQARSVVELRRLLREALGAPRAGEAARVQRRINWLLGRPGVRAWLAWMGQPIREP
jgi:hypothetical protein